MHVIRLRGARTNNLKGVDLDLAPGELVAITGVSGAGKSSLAMDTLYSEGQRRFVESFSPYARQFLERLERPPITELDPIAAAVAVDRRAPVKSSRSTVATMADLEPYLSALFTREAMPVCAECLRTAEETDPEAAVDRVVGELGTRAAVITYPVRVGGTEAFLDVREELLRSGYRRIWASDKAADLDDLAPSQAIDEQGFVHVVVDRVDAARTPRRRLTAAVEEAWRRSGGIARFTARAAGTKAAVTRAVVRGLTCPGCARTFEPPRAGLFSYQSPIGACPTCRGFGRVIGVDWGKVIPDPNLSLGKGAIRPWTGTGTKWERGILEKFCKREGIPLDRAWSTLTETQREAVLTGEGSWRAGRYPGVREWFKWLETRTYKMHVRVLLARYRSYEPCPSCLGKRLSPESLMHRVGGLDLGEWHALELGEARERLDALRVRTGQGEIARSELAERLRFLERVGLGYLTLDRQARTLSGGEAQRVSLTSALGTSLTGALFVLDEPTVGLHPSDIGPLVSAMRELADRGNVVLVVEHDPGVIFACDRVVELGPAAGARGGEIVFDGPPDRFEAERRSVADRRRSSEPKRRVPAGWIAIERARANNLTGQDVRIPLGVLTAIVGVSGSGKSSLADDVLYRTMARALGDCDVEPAGESDGIGGHESIQAVSLVDQAPLGRTSRGNPATYSGAWSRVRALFAAAPSAKAAGLGPGHFSFNVALGRCEACAGEGSETIEMQFLADVRLTCATCGGRRFRDEVLAIEWNGRSVADVLALSVDEAIQVFAREAAIVRALAPISRLGLGYLALGQPLSTLSGGEAQRLKIARALAEVKPGTLYVLDEPSAGLHPREIEHLLGAIDALLSAGASVVVVDHDLDVIRHADWLIELGPGAGSRGGKIVAEGSVADLIRARTRTGRALAAGPAPPSGKAPAPSPEVAAAIRVTHAREHNLREVSTSIPRGRVVVVTGPSGSGKSTLAFDVVFAEGQRRFLETLTPYARQFLPTLPRPDVDRVTGVPPSIALEQRTTRAGASSTVATVTEIAHYLRLLFAKVGQPHCPACDGPVDRTTAADAFARVAGDGRARVLLAPAVVSRKGTYLDIFAQAARLGIERAIVDGAPASTDRPPRLAKRREHTIDLVVYEGPMAALPRATFDRALSLGQGAVKLRRSLEGADAARLVSTRRTCPACGTGVPDLDPRWFSFNTKQGRCEACEGTGLEDPTAGAAGEDDAVRCGECGGSRLTPLPRAVRLSGLRYHEVSARSVEAALAWALSLSFTGDAAEIARAPLAELIRRLAFVEQVGLAYLGLDRLAVTLSGGEMQRLRLSAQLGSGLTGALYVLDEPTIGLHPSDTRRLLDNLRKLADAGSTVLMVEHDADTIRAADHLIDLGPGGGREGGRIVAEGSPAEVLAHPSSPTGRALREESRVWRCRANLGDADRAIELVRPRVHNLRLETFRVPVGRLTVVAGVSGSGKSTLVRQVLYPAVRLARKLVAPRPGRHASLRVPREVERAVAVDQSPIGRTPRSVPATFLGVWDEVRKLFAGCPESKVRGYSATRFSFNSPRGGRCKACEGQGAIAHEMSFLPDVTTACEACGGTRFDPSTLEIRYLGLSVGDVLNLSAAEACQAFAAHPRIQRPLQVMCDLGVGYLKIGQGSHTLSGGEAQRLKLAVELTAGAKPRSTLYVLDEPTTGLHLADVEKLIGVFDRLVARGDTLVVIEHHPAVIAAADWVVELGPGGGVSGGLVVAEGTPATVSRCRTPTGRVLAEMIGATKPRRRPLRMVAPASG